MTLRMDGPDVALPYAQIRAMTMHCASEGDRYLLDRHIYHALSPTCSRTTHVRDARGKGGASTAAGVLCRAWHAAGAQTQCPSQFL